MKTDKTTTTIKVSKNTKKALDIIIKLIIKDRPYLHTLSYEEVINFLIRDRRTK